MRVRLSYAQVGCGVGAVNTTTKRCEGSWWGIGVVFAGMVTLAAICAGVLGCEGSEPGGSSGAKDDNIGVRCGEATCGTSQACCGYDVLSCGSQNPQSIEDPCYQ